jgi:DNA-binding LytR/AlgR family response regulator
MLMEYLGKIERALDEVNEQLYDKRPVQPIFIREGNRIIRLHPDEILYLEGYGGDYVKVHRTNGRPLLSQNSLKNFEDSLNEYGFCRVHRSYIVSLSHIDYIERKRIRIENALIPISDSYLSSLMSKLSL